MTIKLGFIIDVKQVKPVSNTTTELVDLGWTFLSIYTSLENENGSQSLYVNSGLHAVIMLNLYSIHNIATSVSWPSPKRHSDLLLLDSIEPDGFAETRQESKACGENFCDYEDPRQLERYDAQ